MNWDKVALDFLVAVHQLKKERKKKKLLAGAAALLKKATGIDTIEIVELEDSLTARIVYPIAEINTNFTDADLVASILTNDKIVIAANPMKDTTRIYIPITSFNYQSVFLLYANEKLNADKDFLAFLELLRTGLTDIADLIIAHYNLENVQTRFNAILNTVTTAIVFVDDAGRNGWVNKAAAQLLSLNEGSNTTVAISNAMFVLRSKAVNHELIAKEGAELFISPEKSVKDWRWIYGEPISRVLSVSTSPAISQNIKGRLWAFDDITPLYTASQQLTELNKELHEKHKAMSSFLAHMSHEIRTPMNGVIGMADLLATTTLTNNQKDYLDTIQNSGQTLLSLTNDILDLSKIESGKMELERVRFEISKVIEEVYDLLSIRSNEKQLDLLYDLADDVPTFLCGDVTKVKQILLNFVSNAIKFTEKGEVLIVVKVLEHQDEFCKLQISVRDSGIGIPADKLGTIFESYTQTDTSISRRFGGTGLGLNIAQRLIELMGGNVSVESETDLGTQFTFSLELETEKAQTQTGATLPADTSVLDKKRILILDDNQTNLKILSNRLQGVGMKVYAFTHYINALTTLHIVPFDVLLIDASIGGKSGFEVAELAKREHKNIPVVLLGSVVDIPESAKKAFTSVIYKPFKNRQLMETLSAIFIKQKEPSDSLVQIAPPEQVAKTMNILVAEDDPINQKMIGKVSDNLGYNYKIVADGAKVVQEEAENRYQIILMDLMMPVINGAEATRLIKSRYTKNNGPVIVALTASALTDEREALLENGADDYLSKPYKLDDIKMLLQKWELRIAAPTPIQ